MPRRCCGLDLSGMPDLLTVLSGRESSVRRLDRLRDSLGDDPAAWYGALTGQAWPGGAGDPDAAAAQDGFAWQWPAAEVAAE